jgi:hypothetical protein
MSSSNNNYSSSNGDQWDPRFILTFEDSTARRVHAKFIEAASHDKRTGDMYALDSKSQLKRVTNIRVIPDRYR